jgi:hypothetical protein
VSAVGCPKMLNKLSCMGQNVHESWQRRGWIDHFTVDWTFQIADERLA